MTGCAQVRDEIKAWLDGELPFGRRLAIRRHLARCAACREEAAAMRNIGHSLRAAAIGAVEPLDPALRARILAAVDLARGASGGAASAAPAGASHSRLWSSTWAAGAAAAAVLLCIVLLSRPGQRLESPAAVSQDLAGSAKQMRSLARSPQAAPGGGGSAAAPGTTTPATRVLAKAEQPVGNFRGGHVKPHAMAARSEIARVAPATSATPSVRPTTGGPTEVADTRGYDSPLMGAPAPRLQEPSTQVERRAGSFADSLGATARATQRSDAPALYSAAVAPQAGMAAGSRVLLQKESETRAEARMATAARSNLAALGVVSANDAVNPSELVVFVTSVQREIPVVLRITHDAGGVARLANLATTPAPVSAPVAADLDNSLALRAPEETQATYYEIDVPESAYKSTYWRLALLDVRRTDEAVNGASSSRLGFFRGIPDPNAANAPAGGPTRAGSFGGYGGGGAGAFGVGGSAGNGGLPAFGKEQAPANAPLLRSPERGAAAKDKASAGAKSAAVSPPVAAQSARGGGVRDGVNLTEKLDDRQNSSNGVRQRAQGRRAAEVRQSIAPKFVTIRLVLREVPAPTAPARTPAGAAAPAGPQRKP